MKNIGKIAIAIMALALMLCMTLTLIACDGGSEAGGKTTYKVTLKDTDGAPVVGAEITPNGGTAVKTNENGVATFESDASSVSVKVTSLPEGYQFGSGSSESTEFAFKAGNTELVIDTFVKLKKYTVELKDQHGNAVPDASVFLIVNGKETDPTNTDANGIATFFHKGGIAVIAVVDSVSADYDIDETDYSFEANATSITIAEIIKLDTYSVIIKDGSGAAVEGADVQVCVGEKCYVSRYTNAEGKASFKVTPGDNVKVQVNSLPEGYKDLTATEYYYSAGQFEMTVTVEKAAA